jgi:hypothetical protein
MAPRSVRSACDRGSLATFSWSVIGLVNKIYYLELRASEGTLSRWSRWDLQKIIAQYLPEYEENMLYRPQLRVG